MANFKRPDVYIQEQALVSTVDTGINSTTAVGAIVGLASQGPIVPTFVDSWSKFVTLYGGFAKVGGLVPELAYGVYNFFAAGGSRCLVLRVLGASPVYATCSLTDGAATPQATVALTAAAPGVWGNGLNVTAVDRDAANGRFDLTLYSGGTTSAFVVEQYNDVSVDPADSRYIVSLLNAGSQYVTAVNANSATAAPANRVVQVAAKAFTGGSDGAAVGTADYQSAFAAFDVISAPLVMAIPGNTTNAVQTSAITYCSGRTDSFFVADLATGLDAPGAVSAAASLTSSSFAAAYWPRVNMIDPNAANATQLRLSPVSGSVVGLYIANDVTRGVFKAPAGITTKIPGAVSLERKLTLTDLDTLNVGNVNAIKTIPGTGVVVFGARTLKKTAADRYINVRRTLIYIESTLKFVTAFAVFENNDAILWSSVTRKCTQVLAALWSSGGLVGATAQQAFYVTCDATNNTPMTIDTGVVNVSVGVALQQPAEFIVINVGQFPGGSSAISLV